MSFALSCMLLGIFVFCPETDGGNLTWNEPPPTQIVQATVYPVNHNSSRQLFAGTTNATLRWRFALADLKFTSLVIFFEGNSVARVSSEVTGTPPNYAHRFGLDWNPNQNLLKLFIFNVTAEENGTFSCRVTAESLDKFSEFHFASDVQVDVVGAPSNIITSSNQTITAPAELTLNCSADGQPKPTITWTRVSDNTVVTMPLNIIDGKNEQIYRCTADNGVGNPLTKDVIINILFSPKVTLAEKFFVGRGETASLFCQVEGNPKPTISWSPCDLQNVLCDTQYLNISKVETACAIYNCTATNALGIDSATTVLIAGGYNIYMRLGIGGECSGEDSVWKALEKELMGKSHNKESFGNLSLNASSITGIPPVEQTSTAASTSTLPNSDGSASTPWAIIGGVVVGVPVLVMVVSVLIWWVHKQRKCGKDTEKGLMHNQDHQQKIELMAWQKREGEGIPEELD